MSVRSFDANQPRAISNAQTAYRLGLHREVQIMSATGISTFDETVQFSNQWLNELIR
jgi:hypothetical protein